MIGEALKSFNLNRLDIHVHHLPMSLNLDESLLKITVLLIHVLCF